MLDTETVNPILLSIPYWMKRVCVQKELPRVRRLRHLTLNGAVAYTEVTHPLNSKVFTGSARSSDSVTSRNTHTNPSAATFRLAMLSL